MSSILITGANGFVGKALCRQLESFGRPIQGAVRGVAAANQISVGDIHGTTNWQSALTDCHAVVHLAARVHMMQDQAADPLAEFRKTNTAGTLHLARQAAHYGVRRFVFISSIKVNGESGHFRSQDIPAPQDAYGLSKWEAEQGLHEIGKQTGMEIVVIRPPLVYGPGVGANFLRLMRIIKKGLPLPLGCIHNQRSLVYIGNLVDAICAALDHPAAAGNTYLVADRETFSTSELMRHLASAIGTQIYLPCISSSWLRLAARITGKTDEIDRLLDSLVVDTSSIHQDLGWTAPWSAEEGFAETAKWFNQAYA
jgi:nucleoside-diphosphate-sugar epimerase